MNKRVFGNVVWIIACRVIKILLATLVSIMTARMLGPSNYGLINYAASVTAFISPFVLLGFNSILVQEILDSNSAEDEGSIVGTAILSSFVCSFFGVGCSVAVAYFIASDDSTAIGVTLVYSISLIFQAIELIQYWFQAKYRSKTVAWVSVIAYIIVSIYKICLLAFRVSIYWFAFSNAFDYFIIAGILICIYMKEGNSRLRFSRNTFMHLIKVGGYYAISSFMIIVFTHVDKLMIKSILGNVQNGFYSVAVACSGMFTFVFAAIIEAMRPYVLDGKKQSITVFEERLKSLYSILVYLGVICSIVVCISAELIISIVYGNEYLSSAIVLQILIWHTILSCIGGAKDIWILAEQKQKYLLLLNTLGVVLNIIINMILIPKIGIVGAAVATLVTQFFSNILLCIFIKDLRRNMCILAQALNPMVVFKSIKLFFKGR